MIKCEVNVCAVISRAASEKTSKDGQKFMSFGVKLTVTGRDNTSKDMEISVSTDAIDFPYAIGQRVQISGIMNVLTKDERIYYNLRAEKIDPAKKEIDSIDGTMEFLGKTSKRGIEEKNDKKGNPFKAFSAFSTHKEGDKAEFTWVRFLYFNPKEGEDFLKESAYIRATGVIQPNVYNNALTLDCRVNEVAPWELEKKGV